MPTELALLPFIESAFNPQALSTAKASGMWQFMAATGRDFNLKQNMFQDERRDVLASTDAALNYLESCTACSATGIWRWPPITGAKARSSAPSQGDSGRPAHRLQQPVGVHAGRNPQLRAEAAGGQEHHRHPGAYGIVLPKVENQPYFVTIRKTRDIDVQVAAELAELPMEEFKALNPQFNRPVIVGGADTHILLPEEQCRKIQVESGQVDGGAVVLDRAQGDLRARAHRDYRGPFPHHAGSHPRSQQYSAAHGAQGGSTILVPRPEEQLKDIAQEVAESATLAMEPDRPPTRRISVKVGRNDTLASIAARNGVSVDDLKSWNKLSRENLSRGQRLSLHVPTQIRVSARNRRAAGTIYGGPRRSSRPR